MPVLPTIESQQSPRVGGIDTYASPNDFGAQIGAATQQAGQQISQLSAEYRAQQKQDEVANRNEQLANSTAGGAIEFAKINRDTGYLAKMATPKELQVKAAYLEGTQPKNADESMIIVPKDEFYFYSGI